MSLKQKQQLCLQDIRVLAPVQFWAGPTAAGMLADMGAEVIKVESINRPDPLRMAGRGAYPEGERGEHFWNRSGMVIERNRNEYDLTLDLTKEKGKEIFKRLAAVSDVVLENFTVGVMDRLGIGYSVLKEINPSIIMIGMSPRGTTGPYSEGISYGPILEAESGQAAITGDPQRMRLFRSLALPDPLGGFAAAGAVLAAVYHRKKTGKGMFIDLSQAEVASSVVGETFLEYSMTGETAQPRGNRNPMKAPHGCYPCRDRDRWVTVVVESDEEWGKLCEIIGQPQLANDPRFVDTASRLKHQDELDEIIAVWTRQYTPAEAAAKLQGQGITAGPLFSVGDLFSDPHLEQRKFWQTYEQPGEVGPYPYKGTPVRFSKVPFSVRLPAPRLGEHNAKILHEMLGMSPAEIEALERDGIIGDTPVQA